MNPDSYKRCASIMVCATVYPSLRAASCCKVDVVNGAGGVFLIGRVQSVAVRLIVEREREIRQ